MYTFVSKMFDEFIQFYKLLNIRIKNELISIHLKLLLSAWLELSGFSDGE